MNKQLNIVVRLSAMNNMSSKVASILANVKSQFASANQKIMDSFNENKGIIATGVAIGAALVPAIDAYRELEKSSANMRSSFLLTGGVVSSDFERINSLAVTIGNKLPGTTADIQNMFTKLHEMGVSEKDLLGGVGKSTAGFGAVMGMDYSNAAVFAGQMKNATGVDNKDMPKLMDSLQRLKNLGVNTEDIGYSFSRLSGSLKTMGIQGLQSGKEISVLIAGLSKMGMSGEKIGTNMTILFDELLNTKKFAVFNQELSKYGQSMTIFDKSGKFLGARNMMQELTKLQALTIKQRTDLVREFSKGGGDTQALNNFIAMGAKGYDESVRRMNEQASLEEKLKVILGTLDAISEASKGTFTNMLASMGESIAPELKKIASFIGMISEKLQGFASMHPRIFKFIGLFIGITSVVVVLTGVVLLLVGVFALLLIIGIPLLIIAAITAFYVFRDEVMDIVDRLYNYFKKNFILVALAVVFPFYGMPLLIGKILFDGFKKFFPKTYDSMKNFGINMVKSIGQGIKEGIMFLVTAGGLLSGIGNTLLNQLPKGFKENALAPLKILNPYTAVSLATGSRSTPERSQNTQSGNTTGITYSPVITMSPGADKDSFLDMLKSHSKDLTNMVNTEMNKTNRTRFY